MIGSLRGTLLEVGPPSSGARDGQAEMLVEVRDVGYRVSTSTKTAASIGAPGSSVLLYVHTHVREDAIVLYGFVSKEERVCFEALIGTHGVGPSVALAILSVHTPSALRRALVTDDVDALTLVPGIGKKTAARLLIELKSRLELPDLELVNVTDADDVASVSARAEVRSALAGLGYGADEIRELVQGLPAEGSAEALLRIALRQLAALS